MSHFGFDQRLLQFFTSENAVLRGSFVFTSVTMWCLCLHHLFFREYAADLLDRAEKASIYCCIAASLLSAALSSDSNTQRNMNFVGLFSSWFIGVNVMFGLLLGNKEDPKGLSSAASGCSMSSLKGWLLVATLCVCACLHSVFCVLHLSGNSLSDPDRTPPNRVRTQPCVVQPARAQQYMAAGPSLVQDVQWRQRRV
eukprot:GDKI01046054.1.p1 GENE.GDKI01046054.1~~GDKI01046054.1.p1  ORF type:complete len:197 (-),score=7.38 GDKI01046054.1:286-876(-)